MLPRRHYREVARALAEINDPRAQSGVRAINDLLEERARLALRVNRAETGTKKEVPAPKSRSWFRWW